MKHVVGGVNAPTMLYTGGSRPRFVAHETEDVVSCATNHGKASGNFHNL